MRNFNALIALLLLVNFSSADDQKPKTYVFKKVDGVEIQADVYVPAAAGKRPTLVWFHGGALMLNSRASVPPQLIELSREQGYALVSFDYRLAPETLLPEIVADVRDALKWVHDEGPELFQADPDNVIVGGASAGGYLALLTGIEEKHRPKAIVSYWGYGDILGDWCTQPDPNFGKGEAPTKEEAYAGIGDKPITSTGKEDYAARSKLFFYMKRFGKWTEIVSGVDPVEEGKALEAFCPARMATKDFPPLLLLHGTKDPDVPYEQSVQMRDVIRDLGGSVELITVEGGGHGLWGGDKKAIEAAFDRSLEFISEQFKADRDLAMAIEDIAEDAIESGKAVGMTIGVAKGGEILHLQGYGLANIELDVPATADSVYRIGSITKMFTAAAILLLLEDGKLALDDPLAKYLPDYPEEVASKVTIRQLLNHTSGIVSFTDLPEHRANRRIDLKPEQVLARFQNKPLLFEPGERFKYCNSGYYLLGLVIEAAAGQTYEEFLTERIFDPLELSATVYDRHAKIIPNRASGYEIWGDHVVNAQFVSMTMPYAAGALASNAGDLIKWSNALMDDFLLTPESIAAMTAAGELTDGKKINYGLGCFVGKIEGAQTFRHGGGIPGFITELLVLPDSEIVVVVLTNSMSAKPGAIANQIAKLVLEDET